MKLEQLVTFNNTKGSKNDIFDQVHSQILRMPRILSIFNLSRHTFDTSKPLFGKWSKKISSVVGQFNWSSGSKPFFKSHKDIIAFLSFMLSLCTKIHGSIASPAKISWPVSDAIHKATSRTRSCIFTFSLILVCNNKQESLRICFPQISS